MRLDAAQADAFARIALGHVTREYPFKLEHVVTGPGDVVQPRELYPIFFGSFDWHSCVHGWWSLLTLLRLYPDGSEADRIAALADDSFTPEKAAVERAYFERPLSKTFERPYGWGWLLYLQLEASRHPDRAWATALEPLAQAIAGLLRDYLPRLTYPIRVGTHFNTSFGLVLALEWADRFDTDLADTIRAWAADKFSTDRDCQAWEPGGDEFLSPSLMEALCMARALPGDAFGAWFAAFLPRLEEGEPRTLFVPATVSDRSDGKIAHLDGLNLSRAWCWRALSEDLEGPAKINAEQAARDHLETALPYLAGDYMGEHWLVSFALLALITEPKR